MENKEKIFVGVLVLFALSAFGGFLYFYKSNDFNKTYEDVVVSGGNTIKTSSQSYYSETGGEVIADYFASNVSLTIINSDYRNIVLDKISSDNENVYQNTEKNLVLEVIGDDINIYESGKLIFKSFKTGDELVNENGVDFITSATWKWVSTIDKNSGTEITPKNKDAFKVTFTKDGNVGGSTDCNGFGGTFEQSDWKIKIGPLMSTMMYCEGSQESEFTNDFSNSDRFSVERDGSLAITTKDGAKTMVFKPE